MHKKLPYWLVALLLVVVVAIVAVVYLAYTRLGRTTITATFPTAVGISEGSDVRILGVTVGSVDEVTPMGETVEVRLHVQRGVDGRGRARVAAAVGDGHQGRCHGHPAANGASGTPIRPAASVVPSAGSITRNEPVRRLSA